MAISKNKLYELVISTLPDAEIKIRALVDDGDHYEIEVSSEKFAGQTKIAQHRMINQALKGYLGDKLHALSIKTKEKIRGIK